MVEAFDKILPKSLQSVDDICAVGPLIRQMRLVMQYSGTKPRGGCVIYLAINEVCL